ncbi:MAG TPA: ribosomal protein S18-alanine N-acetyltransferase [Vicinamibacteria bacterium]|nr:ribosomal protein S18-alanine N-acetyltransferase [Vicinamibacteria bacterium]
MSQVFLEAACPDDLAALVALERRCHSHPWSDQAFRNAIDDAQALVLVLRGAGARAIVAYGVFQMVADELHIHNLAVAPEQRGRGLGRRLLALVLTMASRRGGRTAHLEVRASNQAALGLYRAAGFRTVGVRRGYYDSPREDAVLLSKEGLLCSANGSSRD